MEDNTKDQQSIQDTVDDYNEEINVGDTPGDKAETRRLDEDTGERSKDWSCCWIQKENQVEDPITSSSTTTYDIQYADGHIEKDVPEEFVRNHQDQLALRVKAKAEDASQAKGNKNLTSEQLKSFACRVLRAFVWDICYTCILGGLYLWYSTPVTCDIPVQFWVKVKLYMWIGESFLKLFAITVVRINLDCYRHFAAGISWLCYLAQLGWTIYGIYLLYLHTDNCMDIPETKSLGFIMKAFIVWSTFWCFSWACYVACCGLIGGAYFLACENREAEAFKQACISNWKANPYSLIRCIYGVYTVYMPHNVQNQDQEKET